MRQAFSALATLIVLPVGFLFLFLANDVRHAWVKAILLLILLVLAVALFIVWVIDHEDFSRRWAHRLARRLHRLSKKISERTVDRLLGEFYDGYHTIRGQWRRMFVPLGWSVAYITVEIMTLYTVFTAFGRWPNPGMVIAAYTLANIISLVGGSLIGLGVFEAGMVGTLVALGSPFTLAFSVTIVYRALNMLIALPPGLYFYRKYL